MWPCRANRLHTTPYAAFTSSYMRISNTSLKQRAWQQSLLVVPAEVFCPLMINAFSPHAEVLVIGAAAAGIRDRISLKEHCRASGDHRCRRREMKSRGPSATVMAGTAATCARTRKTTARARRLNKIYVAIDLSPYWITTDMSVVQPTKKHVQCTPMQLAYRVFNRDQSVRDGQFICILHACDFIF